MTEMTGPTLRPLLLYFNFVFPDSMLIFQSMTGERRPTQRHTQSLAPHPWTPPSPVLTENVQALGTKGQKQRRGSSFVWRRIPSFEGFELTS
jgi:hypothetical protein